MASHYGIHEPDDDAYYGCPDPSCSCHGQPDDDLTQFDRHIADYFDALDDEPAPGFRTAASRFIARAHSRNKRR